MFRFVLACGLVASAVGAVSADPAWDQRNNLTPADFEKASKELAEKGYQPAQITAAVVGKDAKKGVRFLTVWEKIPDGPVREARPDLTAPQYEKATADFKDKGFRPVELCGYEVDGAPRFAAIWEKAPKDAPVREAHPALTDDDYRKLYTALSNKGCRPLRVTGFAVGKETRYASIWEQAPKGAPAWYSRRDLTRAQYQEVFDERLEAGDMVVHLSVYTIDGEPRFAGVWEKAPRPQAWQVRHWMDARQYENAVDVFRGQGMRPLRVTSHAVDGEPRFTALWVRQ
jgi:hypothetical protein